VSDSNTTNLGLVLPEPYGSDDTWGAKLNNNMIIIDTNSGVVANNIVSLQGSINTLNSSISSLSSNVFGNIPTTNEAQDGTNNTKFMTPLRNREAGVGRPHARIADVKAAGVNGQVLLLRLGCKSTSIQKYLTHMA